MCFVLCPGPGFDLQRQSQCAIWRGSVPGRVELGETWYRWTQATCALGKTCLTQSKMISQQRCFSNLHIRLPKIPMTQSLLHFHHMSFYTLSDSQFTTTHLPSAPVSWWSVCGCHCWGETSWWATWIQSCWCDTTRSARTCWSRPLNTTWCLSRGESSATAERAHDAVRALALFSSPLVSVPLKVPIRVHFGYTSINFIFSCHSQTSAFFTVVR